MPTPSKEPKPEPTGTRLVRLRDVSLKERVLAAEECMAEAKTNREAARIFELVYDPGDAGGRIAA